MWPIGTLTFAELSLRESPVSLMLGFNSNNVGASGYLALLKCTSQGLPNGVDLWEKIWENWPKTAWKLQNQSFIGKPLEVCKLLFLVTQIKNIFSFYQYCCI